MRHDVKASFWLGERRCGSAAGVHASLLAGTAVRCSRLMAWREAPGQQADGNSQRRWLGA